MKKKLFFLCTMLAFSASLGSTTKECITKIDDTVNEVNVGGKQGRLDAKVIPDRYIDCPWCGHPTLLNKSDPIHYCGHCGRDIDSVSERKKCPWCNRDNYFSIGENSESCKYCGTNFNQKFKTVECPWCLYSNKIKNESDPKNCSCQKCGSWLNNITEITLNAYYSYKGVKSPLIGCKCELLIYNKIFHLPPIVGYSDENGEVKFNFDYPSILAFTLSPLNFGDVSQFGKNNFKIRVYPGDDNLQVCTANIDYNYFSDDSLQSNNYWKHEYYKVYYPCVETPVFNISLGRNNKCSDIDVAIDSSNPYSDSFGICFYIGQAGLRAKEFATDMMGHEPEFALIALDYQKDRKPEDRGSFYNRNSVLAICCDDWNACIDTIMHEYGHHLQNELENHSLLAGGTHYFDKPSNLKTAWSEGWVEAFASITQHYTPSVRRPKFILQSSSVYNYGNLYYKHYYIEGNNYPGEDCEGAIVQILWDLYDSTNYSGDVDDISLDFHGWFDLTKLSSNKTLKDLYNNFCELYPSKIGNMQNLLAQHGIYY